MISRVTPLIARFPGQFGRGRLYDLSPRAETRRSAWVDDAQLFVTTFLGGLIFMTIYLG